MMARLLSALWLCLALLPLGAAAQEAESEAPSEEAAVEAPAEAEADTGGEAEAEAEASEAETPIVDVPENPNLPDYSDWQRVATRIESSVQSDIASSFALERLRNEASDWRDEFLAAQSLNGARISTVQAQIAALGEPPAEGESEPDAIASRREVLNAQLADLRAPITLAEEAYAQANGLIGEIDAILREREAARLSTRTTSPLSLTTWTTAITALWEGFAILVSESVAIARADLASGAFWSKLPIIGLLTFAGFALILRGRKWLDELKAQLDARVSRGTGVWDFLFSLGTIVFPLAGVNILCFAVEQSGLAGYRGLIIVEALPGFALHVILARWLAFRYFPKGAEAMGPLDMSEAKRSKARWIVSGLGWTLAVAAAVLLLVSMVDASGPVADILLLPFEVFIGIYLFRFGRLLDQHCKEGEDNEHYRNRFIALLGKLAMLIAIAGPLFAVAGYAAAAQALLYPFVTTLALVGLLFLLQRLAVDIYVMLTGAPDSASDALFPVVVAFTLIVVSVPFFALIWGASEAELLEVWARFREGLTIGDTRISPSIFMTFVLVFAIGYVLTRFVQSTVKSSVLPRTKLDVGGQHAVVSGMGYVGIFLAALAAITMAGIDLSSLAIVAGALSVGIGFGLQTIVQNFVSGIILLIERPISEGDWIQVGDQMGHVRDISVRATRIETFDRTDVIIPNADLVSGQVTNWTRGNSVGRVIIPVGVAYGSDTKQIEAILREISEAHPMVLLSPPPNVFFMGFGADSLDFEIRALIRDVHFSFQTRSEINHEISERFAKEGIEIPFAQRDIWLRNPEALRAPDKPEEET